MDDASAVNFPQPIYVLKVLLGLGVLVTLIFTAYWLPLTGLSPMLQWLAISLLVLSSLAIAPIVRWVYLRMDELQKTLHASASMTTLALLASLSCLIGVLQASSIIPLFNQFWTLAGVIVLWGANLMLSDRRFK